MTIIKFFLNIDKKICILMKKELIPIFLSDVGMIYDVIMISDVKEII